MISFPNSKINLGLNILEKRNDGFHNLETLFYPIELSESLEILENKESLTRFTSSGIDIPGDINSNLCLKAYDLLKKDFSLPAVQIHLNKLIPIGAGLGGGSSDAAFTLKLLNEKFELGLSTASLINYAKQLGSDCAFFIKNEPVFAFGKGDEFEDIKISIENYYLIVIYPSIHIKTNEAYAGITPKKPANSIKEIIKQPILKWKNELVNDFEEPIFKSHPELAKIKKELYDLGAVYASMSGSGSAIYGIFFDKLNLPSEFNKFFTWTGYLKQ